MAGIKHGLKKGFIDYELKDFEYGEEKSLYSSEDPSLVKLELEYKAVGLIYSHPSGPTTATLVNYKGFWCVVCSQETLPSIGQASVAIVCFYSNIESSFSSVESRLLPELLFEWVDFYGLAISAVQKEPLENFGIAPIPQKLCHEKEMFEFGDLIGLPIEVLAHPFSGAKQLVFMNVCDFDRRNCEMSLSGKIPEGFICGAVCEDGYLLGFLLDYEGENEYHNRASVLARQILGVEEQSSRHEVNQKEHVNNLFNPDLLLKTSKAIQEVNTEVLTSIKDQLGHRIFSALATKDGRSLCHLAICFGNVAGVEMILELGANMYIKTKQGDDLMLTAAYQGNLDVIKLLQARSLQLNTQNKNGQTMAHKAALRSHVHVLEWLLENDQNLFIEDSQGKIPLDYAYEMFLQPIIDFFVERKLV